jgi:hypothetical protein
MKSRFLSLSDIRYARVAVVRTIALLVCGLTLLFSQTSPVPYAPNSDGPGPTFSNETATNSLPGRYSSIQKVDFRNLKPLKNGRYRENGDGVHYSEELDKVYYLRSPTSNGQTALVLYSWFDVGGSSSQGGVAQVFRIVNSTLQSTQKIGWDTHFQAGVPFVAFDQTADTLVSRSAHYIPGDAHCCVSAMDVVTFRWDGGVFVQADLRTELSAYGKKEGKQLPR